MTTNIINQVAYLRTTRNFPTDQNILVEEISKAYLDTALCVNARTIGLFPTNRPAVTGERFYLTGNREQQGFRQVYTFTATTAITHNITNVIPGQFLNCFGSYTNSVDTFGLIFGSSVAIAGQISFYVTSTQIIFVVGAGAPALSSGVIVLQWVSRP
jgi:hypothetical protein